MKVQGNLSEYADLELRAAGYDPDSPEFVKSTVYRNVMDLIHTFEGQKHSGMSAGWIMSMFYKLAFFKPLGPLTGDGSEWVLLDEARDLWQNNRASHVFREKGEAYDIQGIVFRTIDGENYTNQHSKVPVVFPYTPNAKVVLEEQWEEMMGEGDASSNL